MRETIQDWLASNGSIDKLFTFMSFPDNDIYKKTLNILTKNLRLFIKNWYDDNQPDYILIQFLQLIKPILYVKGKTHSTNGPLIMAYSPLHSVVYDVEFIELIVPDNKTDIWNTLHTDDAEKCMCLINLFFGPALHNENLEQDHKINQIENCKVLCIEKNLTHTITPTTLIYLRELCKRTPCYDSFSYALLLDRWVSFITLLYVISNRTIWTIPIPKIKVPEPETKPNIPNLHIDHKYLFLI